MAKDKGTKSKISLLLSIFFISVSLFVYQVVLTRLYSAVFSYHYVFLITSFAIFGLGIGSVFAYKIRTGIKKYKIKSEISQQRMSQANINEQIIKGSITLSLSYIFVIAFNYELPFENSVIINIIFGTAPFIIGGYLYSILFTEFSEVSGKLYFADLVGSGIGSITVIFLLNNAGIFRTVILVCAIAFLPALILPAENIKIKIIGFILPAILLTGFLLPGQYVNLIETNFKGILNNTSKTFGSMKKSGMSPEIVFSKWNAFSRTDVIKLPEEPDEMVLTIDGAANAPMYKFDGNVGSLEKFKADTGFIPFTIGSNDKTLLIGPGGGRDVLYALAGGSKNIAAVDINTSSIDAVEAFGEYNGKIYNRPEVKVYGEDGRNFVRRSTEKYDLIFLSLVMTNTSQGMAYALSENYIYTLEAMKDYLDHLNVNGKIAFLAHDQDDLSKIVATAIEALGRKGISEKDAPKYIAIFTKLMPQEHGGANMVMNPVVIIKDSPFSESESKELMDTAQKNENVPLYTPFVYEQGVLQHIKKAHISIADYINGISTNATPATDDSPYFYNFNKGVPSTLILILLLVAIASIILFAPFAVKNGNFKPTTYFSLLGVGFMMIEVPLIQKFTLFLGHPALAFTYVLAALLVGCGIGGYASNKRIFNESIKAFYLPPLFVAVINIAMLLSLGFIFQSTTALNPTIRIVISSVLVMFQGFFMGMPFPRGLKLIGESGRAEAVPVMWGVNGAASVIGSVLSVVISMTLGFTGALIIGAVIYLSVSFYKNL